MPPENDIEEVTAEAPADDVRSLLTAALAESDAPAVETTTPETPEDKPADSRVRAPDGKFAKAEEPVAEVPEGTPSPATTPATPAEPAAPVVAEAPPNWSAADKAVYAKLPVDAQEFLVRRHRDMEADHTRKTQEIAAFKRDYGPLEQMFAPHKDIMQQKGFTPATLVNAWYNFEKSLVDGKGIEAIKGLVSGYNIDRNQLAAALGIAPGLEQPQPEGGQPQAQIPPELMGQLQRQQAWIDQQERVAQQRQQQEYEAKQSRVMNEIETFSTASDKAGQPLYPYFAEVENHMAVLATAAKQATGAVPPLADLYDQAVWANTSTREKLLASKSAADEAQRGQAEADRQKEARAKAERSKRAGSSVTGSPGTGQASAPKRGTGSIRDELEAAAEEYSV